MRKRSKFCNLLVVLLLMALSAMIVSCIEKGPITDPTKMTPKQRVTFMYSAYNSQFSGYMVSTGYAMDESGEWKKVSDPVLSEDKKKALRIKKQVLKEVYPLIKLYNTAVITKSPTDPEVEAQIYTLLDRLADLDP